ncbi:MAG: hypothetical protein J4432_05560, partial [DPANN group archaeon]|nr:hypothetical protein [DPANN group archaeon]
VKCLAGQEFIKASLDASTDQLCIKATESLDGAGSSATCLTFTPVNTFTQTDISTPQFSAAMPSGKQILGVSSDGSRFFLTDGQPSSNLKTSIDNGANWVAGGDITIPQTGDFSGFFSDSTFEPTKVFALTDGRTTPAVSPSVHSSTDGASWTTVAILTVGQADASTAEDLYFVDATTAYIVGQDSGEGSTKSYIAKTTDSGATWTKIDNLDDGTGTALDVIDIVTLTVSGNTRYVVIGTNTANSKGVIRYSDDALTWIELEITTMTKGLAMELDADGNAIGVFTDGTSIFIFESSNGVDWTQVGSEFGSMDSLAGLYLHKLSGQLYGIIESVGAIIYQGSGVDWTKDTAIGSFMSSSVLGIASAGQTLLVAGGSGADTNVKLAIKNSDTESGGDTFTLFEGGTEKASDATGTTLACLSEDVTSNTIVPTCVSVSLCPTDGSGCSTLDVKRGVGYEFELEQSIDSGAETLVGKIFAGEGQ